ncbi:AT-rich interactive domain-containing protein 5B isoform X2 [Pygocentrus nattereri]|uniref:AT-rich interactive domain-containing protein 5B isoform X2 n=1 Tax=Pygocentrus nattereri TaxID=42514 RepID=UPI001891675C|nr:AT-rich interactive domain-containing protein 5B isoform X2 [Pygocentrus nattereri]
MRKEREKNEKSAPESLQWVGSPCGLHGPYVFYKAFRFNLEGKARILSLGDFFFVRCKPEDPVCIAELQLLWEERTSKQLLSSSKLYFLPEDTPQGRSVAHGEDEIIAVSEKVIVKLEDLVKWTVWDASCWKKGLRAMPLKPSALKELGKNGQREALHRYRESTLNSGLNFKDVLREKAELGDDAEEKRVLVLSYPQYCRYRSIIARLRERPASLLTDQVVLALGGIASLTSNTQILYCRDTFEHPTLLENESICDEFAPNLKGRPRKKKLSFSQRRDSQGQSGNSKDPGSTEGKSKVKGDIKAVVSKPKSSSSAGCKRQAQGEDKPKEEGGEECRAEEQAFLVALYKYMKERKTPIERIPYLGFKQTAQKLGGYELITARRQWKNVYDELGGNPGSTSAATCTRRHYERLILPYERYTKGEEDKPLPPIKPRKQEAGAQEGGSKTKVPATKRLKDDQNLKGQNENDATAKVPEQGAEDVEDKEHLQEEVLAKQKAQQSQLPAQREGDVKSPTSDDGDMQLIIKEEEDKLVLQKALWDGDTHEPINRSKHASLPQDGTPLKSEDCDVFPVAASMPLRHSHPFTHPHTQDQWHHGTPDYKVPPYTLGNIEQAGLKENQNHVVMVLPSLKQRPLQPLSVPEIPTERAELPTKEESFSFNSLLYPRTHPGIMSPLAKKKMLSQVSGTGLPNNYPYGPPPPLVNKKASASSTEETAAGQHGPQVPSTASEASVVIKRPSVIQHAQSFKSRGSEDRRPSAESSQKEMCNEEDSYPSEPLQHQTLQQSQTSPTGEPYVVRTNPHSSTEKSTEIPRPGQAPSFLGDFYSSPHLHSLFRQTEHHLSKEQLSKYLSREAYPRDTETAHGFPQSQQPDSGSLTYCARLNQKEKGTPTERVTEEQPTDLSLPKPSPHKLPHSTSSLCGLPHSMMQQDVKSTPLFQAGNSQSSSLDYHPRACRVPPMTVSTPKKVGEPQPKAHNGRGEETLSYKIDDMARPILSTKSNPQNVGAARPLKRNLEELENGPTEKKIRAVTPMHCSTPRDIPVKVRTPEPDNESMKPAEPAHAVHINSYAAEGHKFPLHSPIFPGLYPGAFVSQVQDMCDSLSPHVPPGYSHPLQYLKNQAVISPLMPPFAIHSIMMQRQFLAQAANPAHLYRHPVGTSYGDILHHGLYPMSALNPQPAFSPPQLSSVHPSTKLS